MARELENALTLPDTPVQIKTEASAPAALHGSVMVLIQFDVCEEIRLDRLREIFSARTVEQPSFKHPAPGYVRYQRPPVVEPIEPLVLESGERLQGQIKYYDYGVLSVVLELPFSGDWDAMIRLGSRWVWEVDFERQAARIARQLLEFRHYDELLTRELEGVYASLDKGTGMLARWRMARDARKLHTVFLDVTELTEHADNAIKFLSDMFSARLYKLAAAKVGVPDYKDLVNQKLQTAEELYRFMVDQFNQSRAFALELMVMIILIIELLFLFHGHGTTPRTGN